MKDKVGNVVWSISQMDDVPKELEGETEKNKYRN